MRAVQEILYGGLAYLFERTSLRHLSFQDREAVWATEEAFVADRIAEVDEYLGLFSRFCSSEAKIVLDLGCYKGYFLDAFLRKTNFCAIGADVYGGCLAEGQTLYGDRIRFVLSSAVSIPLETASVDIVYTIDTIEHLSHPAEMLNECYRILKPGGLFLGHFHPWLGPSGSHLGDIIPFPWPHVMFSMDTLLAVASRRFEAKTDKLAFWQLDMASGRKRENPFGASRIAAWDIYLNRLTIRGFRRLLRDSSFRVRAFEKIGFGGHRFSFARHLRWLSQIPGIDEFFTSAVFCVLEKSGPTPSPTHRSR